MSFENVPLPHPDKCIIYLDPPYKDTGKYEIDFNHDRLMEYVIFLRNE